MGVVRQAVKTSAGRSGDCGRTSFAPQAASRMHSRMGSSSASLPYPAAPPIASISCQTLFGFVDCPNSIWQGVYWVLAYNMQLTGAGCMTIAKEHSPKVKGAAPAGVGRQSCGRN